MVIYIIIILATKELSLTTGKITSVQKLPHLVMITASAQGKR